MSEKDPIADLILSNAAFKDLDKKIKDHLEETLKNLTQLSIKTTGEGDKYIETIIKLTGDVSTTTTLPVEQLAEYHEKLANFSLNIIKTYAQIFTMLISVLIPWAGFGFTIPSDTMKNITELIKAINLETPT
jgi:hypothetical protein